MLRAFLILFFASVEAPVALAQLPVNVSATIYYTFKESRDRQFELARFSTNDFFNKNPRTYFNTLELGAAAVGQSTIFMPASYADAMNLLHRESEKLTLDERLLVMSEIGSRLSKSYDYSFANRNSPADLFNNARALGTAGGICGDIHNYLAESAKALGFTDAGLHTARWLSSGRAPSGHILLHYRDGKTGDVYIQNYDGIINTGQKNILEAVDLSTRILGPMTTVSMVRGRENIYHAYTPKMARWLFKTIDDLIGQAKPGTTVVIEASNESGKLGIAYQRKLGNVHVSAFAMGETVSTDVGDIKLGLIGAEVKQSIQKLNVGPFDEAGVSYRVRAGVYSLSAPIPFSETSERHNENLGFYDVQVSGWARIDSTKGEIEFLQQSATIDAQNLKNSPTVTRIKIRGSQAFRDSTEIQVERGLVAARENYDRRSSVQRIEYDRIGVVLDTRKSGRTAAYLVLNGDYYLLEGFSANAAQAIHVQLKAVLPAGRLGEFSFLFDASRITSNHSNDPVYQYFGKNTAARIKLAWQKQIAKQVTVGFSAEERRHEPYFLFDRSHPLLNRPTTKPNRKLQGWVRIDFN